MAEFSIVSLSEIGQIERWDAEFFGGTPKRMLAALERIGALPLSSFITNAQRGQAPAYDISGTVPVIRTVNVRDLGFSDARQEYVTETFLRSASKGGVEQYDILVTSTGVGTLGRVFCNLSNKKLFADGHITVLTPKPDVDYSFLTAVLQSLVGQVQLERWQRGSSGQIEIYPDDILQVRIPKLSESLQNRISALWRESVELVARSQKFYP